MNKDRQVSGNFVVKVHKAYRLVVALCDSDLVGRKFEEFDLNSECEMQLDLSGGFFRGDKKSESEVRKVLADCDKEDANFFIVGEKSVDLAKDIGLVDDSGVKFVDSVPVALVLL